MFKDYTVQTKPPKGNWFSDNIDRIWLIAVAVLLVLGLLIGLIHVVTHTKEPSWPALPEKNGANTQASGSPGGQTLPALASDSKEMDPNPDETASMPAVYTESGDDQNETSDDHQPGQPALPQNPEFCYYRSFLNEEGRRIYDTAVETLSAHENVFTVYNVTDNDSIGNVINYLNYDHPEFFWITGGSNWTCTSTETTVTLELNEHADHIDSDLAKLEDICTPIVAALADASDYEKVKGVYEYVIEHTVYDASYGDQSLCSVMFEGRGLCAGYSRSVQYLLQELGIQTIFVNGYGNGEDHSWNIVRADGSYYMVDATWGDPVMEGGEQVLNYAYLCITTDECMRDHTADDPSLLPYCTATEDNYFVHEGLFLETYSENAVETLLRKAAGEDGVLRIKFGSEAEYQKAIDLFSGSVAGIWPMIDRVNASAGTSYRHYIYNLNDTLLCLRLTLSN